MGSRRQRWLWVSIGFYLFLLLASTVTRQFVPEEGKLRDGQRRVELPPFHKNGVLTGTVQMAYKDLPPLKGHPDAPVIVLVHGSPVGSVAVEDAAQLLRRSGRVILPDLPGFGASTIDVPDYSTRAGARYVLALLDRLDVERAYFVGYSMGGGVILNIAEIAPERVEGLIMVSAIGVQEHELLGDYTLNHGLHALQLAGVWLMQNFLPHFGCMDRSVFNVAYARNFFDTDQRPFRSIIKNHEGPILILHGEADAFVPPRAAAEHARIARQPKTHWFQGGHLGFLTNASKYVHEIDAFVKSLRDGTFVAKVSKPSAEPQGAGYGLVMLLLILGTQVAEDFTCVIGGVLASRDVLPYWAASLACALGIFIGDMLLYLAGFVFGPPVLKRAPMRWFVSEASVNRMAQWYHRRGGMIILLARFVPGLRLPCYVAAGVLRIPLGRFMFFFLIAVVAWTPILVGIAYLLGDVVLSYMERFEKYAIVGLIGFFMLAWLVFRWVLPLITWRGRRMVLSRWKRLKRWEYWPLWTVYAPVFFYILYEGLKYRCPALFTAANPGIENGGGLAQERKSSILQSLNEAGESIAEWVLLHKSDGRVDNMHGLKAFMGNHGLTYPIVLKPDIGERGQGVAIIRDTEEAADYLQRCIDDTIAQRFVEGLEYGVFWYRYPGESRGHIFGITEKRFPAVTGDGQSTLEMLILRDKLAVAMAPYYLKKFQGRLEEIPMKGESVILSELGTHCRGSLFLDSSELVTDALIDAMDAISKKFDGFYYGRFDLRVPSVEDFQAGKNIRVIELNGLSSEATYIYDPQHGYWYGIRTLMRQWRIAFRIGYLNRMKGYRPISSFEVFRLFFKHRGKERFEA